MTNSEILQIIRDSENNHRETFNRWVLLLVSAFVFAGAGALRWDIEFTVLVAIAIFIHELGHLLAMKLCRYKNLKMMFLPLIGGVASGRPSDYDSGKIAVISLLGPVIGYASCCAAVALWFFTEQDILLDYAFLAVILNAFNLLPVIPLDGGHFLNETLFTRLPAAELLFNIAAIAGLGILALTLQAWILIIPAYLLFASLFSRYKTATMTRTLRNEESMSGTELTEDKIERIREEIRRTFPTFDENSREDRLPGVVHNAWAMVNKKFPRMRTAVLLLSVYVFMLLFFPFFGLAFLRFLQE